MKIQHLKAAAWLAAAALGGYLVWFVADFLDRRAELSEAVPRSLVVEVLNDVPVPEPPRDDVVAYDLVKRTFHEMNWTGKQPPVVVEAPAPEPQAPPAKPVSELLRVHMVQFDANGEAGSRAVVKYRDPELVAAAGSTGIAHLKVGDELPEPHSTVFVDAILPEGVRFAYADGSREAETVAPTELRGADERIVVIPVDGEVIAPLRTPGIFASPEPFRVPKTTQQVGSDAWIVGTDDREYISQNYSRILAEVRTRKHRDRNGKVDGVELVDVPSDSYAAKYGAEKGMVVKSINGHPVTSVQEAISFAKQNAEKYTTWEIVYEKQGKTYTKVIDTPQE